MTQISNRTFSFLTALVLLALIAQSSAELIWHFFTPTQDEASTASTQPHSAQPNSLTLNQLPLNLFGTPKTAQPTTQPKVDSTRLKRTQLNLTLIGVLEKGDQSVAILKRPGKDDTAYKLGETIQRGVTLSAVHATWVVLDNNGQAEKLVLPGIKEDDNSAVRPKSTAKTDSNNSNLTIAQQRKLDHYKKLIQQNPMNLMKAVRVNPHYQNGQLQGFQVMPGTERSIFKALGFQSRDIITEVNGVKFNSMAVAMQKGPKLINAQTFNIKLIRNNQPTELTVNLAP